MTMTGNWIRDVMDEIQAGEESMNTNETPVDIKFTQRNVEPPEQAREYALDKLADPIYSVPNLRHASIEVIFESTGPVEQRYLMEVAVEMNGSMLRVEERGPDVQSVTNTVRDVLERRIRDWKGEVYFERRKAGTEQKEAEFMERTELPPEDRRGEIMRRKSFELKPMFVEDAIEQMELLDHDFYFFLNAESGQHNVVYRRKAGGYGWIEPDLGEAEAPA